MDSTQLLLNAIGFGFRGGTLKFTAGARSWSLGDGHPLAEVRLHHPRVLRRILRQPGLMLGETYMDRGWEPGDGGLLRVLEVGVRFEEHLERILRSVPGLALLGHVREWNPPAISRRNAEHHYNLDAELYHRFLDDGMFYSCAYFQQPDMSLEAAQQAKCALIARKLDLRPGAQVLDIGCGWGGLAIHLARECGARVTGITLSSEQLTAAQRRVAALGLQRQITLQLADYRHIQGQFDAVVSVGMFEHVGRPHYQEFFRRVHTLLKPDGNALIHTIGRLTPPGVGNAWIRKHIFPGGYVPAASEAIAAQEASGLLLTDLEIWRLHYALTLQHWNARFQAARGDFANKLGERFCRMWEFYLQGCEAAFRWGSLAVFHLQLSAALDRLPLTRDYLYTARQGG